MFDFKEYKDFLEKEKNFFNEENKKLISFAQVYIEVVNNIEFKDYDDASIKEKNIINLEINAFLMIKEILDNIFLKNISLAYSGCRNIIECFTYLRFLKMNDYYTNRVFYRYGETRFVIIPDEKEINKFENEFETTIKAKQDSQWIKIVNKHNKYNEKDGFASILDQVYKKDEEYCILYKVFCKFVHISQDSFIFKYKVYLNNENEVDVFINCAIEYLIIQFRYFILESVDVLDKKSENNKKLYDLLKKIEEI